MCPGGSSYLLSKFELSKFELPPADRSKFELSKLELSKLKLSEFELPKLDSYDDHFFVILQFPPLAQKIGISKNSQLSIFVGKNFLVTVHQGDLKTDNARKMF